MGHAGGPAENAAAPAQPAAKPAPARAGRQPRHAAPAAGPTLEAERRLAARGHRLVGGCDEVGRGALAGPVSVGLVVVDPLAAGPLPGVRDSKLLSAVQRESLAPLIRAWAAAWGVGHASAAEIDALGLVPALRLAGVRAWEAASATARPDVVLLDGNLDWLGRRERTLFAAAADDAAAVGAAEGVDVPVALRVKADLDCLSVAAASVLAKVERDSIMAAYDGEFPGFGWARNKGYGTAAHRLALAERGPSGHHRLSWRLTAADQAQ